MNGFCSLNGHIGKLKVIQFFSKITDAFIIKLHVDESIKRLGSWPIML